MKAHSSTFHKPDIRKRTVRMDILTLRRHLPAKSLLPVQERRTIHETQVCVPE